MDLFNQASNYRKQLRRSVVIPAFLSLATLVIANLLYPASWAALAVTLAVGVFMVVRICNSFFYQLRRQVRERSDAFRTPRWHTVTSVIILLFCTGLVYAAFQLDPATTQAQSIANTKFSALALFGVAKINIGYWALVKKLVVKKQWQKIKRDRPPLTYR